MAILIHHLRASASERIAWLCEELGVDYELKIYKRAPALAPPEYRSLHPEGSAPVIEDGDLTLAESGACFEYISHVHAQGRLFVPSTDPNYANFLYWWHWANGTLQPNVLRAAMAARLASDDSDWMATFAKERLTRSLNHLNERLRENTWLAGSEFTVADVMVVFSLTTMRYFFPYSLREYTNIVSFLKRVGERGAYQRAMKRSDPDMVPALGAEPPEAPLA